MNKKENVQGWEIKNKLPKQMNIRLLLVDVHCYKFKCQFYYVVNVVENDKNCLV